MLYQNDWLSIDINSDSIIDLGIGAYLTHSYTNISTTNYVIRSYRATYYASLAVNDSYQNSIIENYYYGVAALPERYLVKNNLDTVSNYNHWIFDSYYIRFGGWVSYYNFGSIYTYTQTSTSSGYSTWVPFYNSGSYGTGSFPTQGDRFVGIRLEVDSVSSLYGWIRVEMPDYGDSIIVKDWAYQTAVNRGLYTGIDNIVPGIELDIDTTDNPSLAISITFDEEILDTLQAGDLLVSGGTLDSLVEITAYREYMAYATKSPDAVFEITIPDSKLSDLWGNLNEEVTADYRTYIPTGLSSISKSDYTLYPNPVNNIMTVELNSPGKITIADPAGKVMLIRENVTKDEFDLSNFTSGMYVVKIQTKDGIAVQKIVKE
jgi:hypothetical protein